MKQKLALSFSLKIEWLSFFYSYMWFIDEDESFTFFYSCTEITQNASLLSNTSPRIPLGSLQNLEIDEEGTELVRSTRAIGGDK